MSVSDQVETFLAVTGSTDAQLARTFLEMSNNNLEASISLFFEHGPSIVSSSANGTSSNTASVIEGDEDLAERLQNEAYEQPQINVNDFRPPDQAVHERLIGNLDPFGGSFGAFQGFGSNTNNMFGGGSSGVFNQSKNDQHYNENDYSDSDEEDGIMEVDGNGEPLPQQKLTKSSRPPFDLIEKIDLDTAKAKARRSRKWVLINIQDDSDFQSQILNRDFWTSLTIKGLVKREFVFLQYHKDSRSGGQYSQFYEVNSYPHIAILDPITGERLKSWSGVPVIKTWYREVEDFLTKFSLEKGSVNPVTEEDHASNKFKTEKFIKNNDSVIDLEHSGKVDDPIEIDDSIVIDDDQDEVEEVKELTEEEQIKSIEAIDVPEPTDTSLLTTRIQIRTSDGKRVVRKFKLDDKVLVIYQFIKNSFDKAGDNTFFTLTSQRENLFIKINDTIGDAGLKNASILLEFEEADDDETNEQ